MEKFKLDFVSNTLTITKAFEEKLQDFNSSEFKKYKEIKESFPNIKVVRRTHNSPKKYNLGKGETSSSNPSKNLTYKNMESFIALLPNNDEYMAQYCILKEMAKTHPSAYAIVRKWFAEQFPCYRSNPLFYINNHPQVIEACEFEEKEAA